MVLIQFAFTYTDLYPKGTRLRERLGKVVNNRMCDGRVVMVTIPPLYIRYRRWDAYGVSFKIGPNVLGRTFYIHLQIGQWAL